MAVRGTRPWTSVAVSDSGIVVRRVQSGEHPTGMGMFSSALGSAGATGLCAY